MVWGYLYSTRANSLESRVVIFVWLACGIIFLNRWDLIYERFEALKTYKVFQYKALWEGADLSLLWDWDVIPSFLPSFPWGHHFNQIVCNSTCSWILRHPLNSLHFVAISLLRFFWVQFQEGPQLSEWCRWPWCSVGVLLRWCLAARWRRDLGCKIQFYLVNLGDSTDL